MRISDWSSDVCSSDLIILGSIDFVVRRAAASREERNRSRQSGDHGLFHDISRSGGRDSDPWNGSACRTSAKLDLFVESFADLLQLVGGIFLAGELRFGIAVTSGICTRSGAFKGFHRDMGTDLVVEHPLALGNAGLCHWKIPRNP